jgi:glycosyltransferase involved in cell wall biosynthesis
MSAVHRKAAEISRDLRPVTFSVVVPTYRRAAALKETLAALAALDYPADRFEVIVVDDGGDEASARVVDDVRAAQPTFRYVAQPNQGPASARNHGARVAEGEVLVFCDDDAIVEPEHLWLHLATRERHRDALVSGVSSFWPPALERLERSPFGRYRIALELEYEADADGAPLGDGCAEVALLSARNLAVGRERFFELGAFDEAFTFAGAEDQDLSLRARAAGSTLLRDHAIRVFNNESTITLEQFCMREERNAQTVVLLSRRFPEVARRPLLVDNAPMTRSDEPGLRVRKAIKRLLATRPALTALGAVADTVQRLPVPEALQRRVFSLLVGIHIFRGVRAAVPVADGSLVMMRR